MTSPIKFGTDGWRGIIADDFTFANVARCSQGLADYIRIEGSASRGLVVGYDTRFRLPGVCRNGGIGHIRQRHWRVPVPGTGADAGGKPSRGAAGRSRRGGHHVQPQPGGLERVQVQVGPGRQRQPRPSPTRWNCALSPPALRKSCALDDGRAAGLVQDIDPAPAYREAIASLVNLEAHPRRRLDGAGGRHARRRRRLRQRISEGGSYVGSGVAGRTQPRFSRHGPAGTNCPQSGRTLPACAGRRSIGGAGPGRGRRPHRAGGRKRPFREHAGSILACWPCTCWNGATGARW